jgi:hypothetical protein
VKDEDIDKIVWVRAEKGKGPDLCIIYYDKDHNELIRYKDPTPGSLRGSKSWRHNNPGNLKNGDHARKYGAIGSAGYSQPNSKRLAYYAIFPSYETGRNALINLLKREDYIVRTLNDYLRKYLGVEDGKPDTKEVIQYRKALKNMTNFDMERTIESLSDHEFKKLLEAIERQEGWHPGDETFEEVKEVIGVRFKRGVASEFLVKVIETPKTWVSKAEAILLAEARKLWVVLVHGKYGLYIRPYPHQPTFHDLIC